MENLKKKVEAYLFIISKGLKIHELAEKLKVSEREVEDCLIQLRKDYEKNENAFRLVNFNDLFRLTVDTKLLNDVNELVPTEFNKSIIKTLSVIAWKQGITQGEVVRIRGNKAYDHIKTLTDYDFIKSEPNGKSFNLSLSNKFFEYFNIQKGEENFIFKQFNE